MRRFLNVGRDYPPRLVGIVLTTIVVGTVLAVGAAYGLASNMPSGTALIGIGVFFVFTLLAELRPVPVDLEGKHLVSLAFVFIVSSQILYSWEASVLLGALAIAAAQLPLRVPPFKLLFNTSVYAIAAGVATLPALATHVHGTGGGYGVLTAVVVSAGALFVLTNVVLVCFAVAIATEQSAREVLVDHLRHSGPAFSIMVFLAAQTVIFWGISPLLLILVGAPLFTLNLYQRSSLRGRVALKAASTDSLTGLKNHRAYQEEVESTLEAAAENRESLTLCLIDVDLFKLVNDRHGHPVGDEILRLLGRLLEEVAPGSGYRLGGDELAVIVPGEAAEAACVMTELQARFRVAQTKIVSEHLTISGGIATYPVHATEAGELKKCADLALYKSKHNGKNCTSIYASDDVYTALMNGTGTDVVKDARLRTAERLVAVVDARDAYVGRHSAGVARLAESVGQVLGLEAEELRELRLAGLLHDLGKIAVPDNILDKPGPLDDAERELMRKHSQTGFELLDGLDLAPIDTWVLHHHEHWDGSGYPHGLAGEEIPFGSRIILVADAFEAMTTHRSYQRAISVEAAMQELHDKAGTQFDPVVVRALDVHLASSGSDRAATLPFGEPLWST